jgi:cell filamentation protein
MSGEFRSWGEFFWPGTEVLRNKLGLREQAQLEKAERALTYGRLVELRSSRPVAGRFDLAHLQAIHAYLFQDVYVWAGKLRTSTLGKGETQFCRPEHIMAYAREVFGRLADNDFLRDLDVKSFIHEAAEVLGDLNALHPFREGNGRTQRAFMELLSDDAGYPIVWLADMELRNVTASIESVRGDNAGLRELISRCVPSPGPPLP